MSLSGRLVSEANETSSVAARVVRKSKIFVIPRATLSDDSETSRNV